MDFVRPVVDLAKAPWNVAWHGVQLHLDESHARRMESLERRFEGERQAHADALSFADLQHELASLRVTLAATLRDPDLDLDCRRSLQVIEQRYDGLRERLAPDDRRLIDGALSTAGEAQAAADRWRQARGELEGMPLAELVATRVVYRDAWDRAVSAGRAVEACTIGLDRSGAARGLEPIWTQPEGEHARQQWAERERWLREPLSWDARARLQAHERERATNVDVQRRRAHAEREGRPPLDFAADPTDVRLAWWAAIRQPGIREGWYTPDPDSQARIDGMWRDHGLSEYPPMSDQAKLEVLRQDPGLWPGLREIERQAPQPGAPGAESGARRRQVEARAEAARPGQYRRPEAPGAEHSAPSDPGLALSEADARVAATLERVQRLAATDRADESRQAMADHEQARVEQAIVMASQGALGDAARDQFLRQQQRRMTAAHEDLRAAIADGDGERIASARARFEQAQRNELSLRQGPSAQGQGPSTQRR